MHIVENIHTVVMCARIPLVVRVVSRNILYKVKNIRTLAKCVISPANKRAVSMFFKSAERKMSTPLQHIINTLLMRVVSVSLYVCIVENMHAFALCTTNPLVKTAVSVFICTCAV
jgi:hypothetical protein